MKAEKDLELGKRCHGGFCLHRIIAVALSVSCVCSFCDPMDFSPPSSSVYGISQARIQEWVAISFFRGSSRPRDRTPSPTLQADALPSEPPAKPNLCICVGFPGGTVVKNPPANVRDVGSIPGSERFPGGGNGNLL